MAAMSLLRPIDLRHLDCRKLIAAIISGRVDRVEFSPKLDFSLTHDGSQAVLTINKGVVEADLPGPLDPDILKITLLHDHAFVDLRITQLRIDY
jgi:hypothetical protein